MKYMFLAVVLVFSGTIAVSAQTQEPSPTPAPDLSKITDSRLLFIERTTLIDQLTQLDQSIEELRAKVRNLPPVETLRQDLKRFEADQEKEKKLASPDTAKLEANQRFIDTTTENLEMVKNSAPLLQQKIRERGRQQQRLQDVEQRITSLFDATRDVNRFKTNATYAFSGLVLIVVGGFFFIAYRKDGIAAQIFSGEMGMQFVTLFLIVIAIILFGIMGTLEGRELAALLGGLSGYILGKAGLKAPTPQPNPNPSPGTALIPNPNPVP